MDAMEVTPSAELTNKSAMKHKRIVYEPDVTQRNDNFNNNLPMLTNGCKRLRIAAIDEDVSKNKRGLQDTKVDCSAKPKRLKITWP